ncbi:MAG: alpha/beta fold hydrolase [Candidatus Limnocylindria bacterium]
MTAEAGRRERPRPFAEDWSVASTLAPPTTIANPLGAAGRPDVATLRPASVGPRFRRYAVEDLAGAPNVDFYWGGVDLSPDGAEVAFSWNRSGAFEVYAAPLFGDRIIQLTSADRRSVVPKWSPDGAHLAFLRDSEGDENMQVWLVDRDGVRERRLTHDDAVMHRQHSWSPDGTRIAYTANAGGRRFAVFVIDVATGEQRRLTDGREDDQQPRWSPDGKWISFWSRRESLRTNADLFLVPAAGGDARRLDTRGGVDGEAIDARWSPDGAALAFTTNVRGRYEIAVAHLQDGEMARLERLGATPFDDTEPTWRPDGRGLLYRHNRDADVSVRRVFTISRADEAITDVPGVHHSPRLGPDSETLVAVLIEARRPADLIVRPPRATVVRRVTPSLPENIDPEVLVEPAHMTYPGADGLAIGALLYVPHVEAIDASTTPPAVMYVHGGPTAQHFRQWDPIPQVLANHGYVVLAPNIRGSTGYGRDFQEGNRHDWGGKDLEDVVRGAEWLEREGIADGERIGIRGGSYGGYMTLMCLAVAPDRFAAGVSTVGVVNWATMYGTTRGDLQQYLIREFGDPERDAVRYRDRSPLTHASKIRSPLLVLQGANDPRVPLAEAEQLVAELKKRGVAHEYHVYPDEGHAFAKRHNRIDAQQRALDWFERHLRPASAEA